MRPTKAQGRADIAAAIRLDTGLSHPRARKLVDEILDQMCATLSDGQTVSIVGFGVFEIRRKGARLGRNPRTQELRTISSRNVVRFRPSALLLKRLNLASEGLAFLEGKKA